MVSRMLNNKNNNKAYETNIISSNPDQGDKKHQKSLTLNIL